MSDYSFTYQHDGFSLEQAGDAGLFIKLGKTGFSFLIASQGRLLAWKDQAPLTALTDDAALGQILASVFKEVRVGLLPEALTLVPAELYTPENTVDYARYLDVKPGNKIFSAKLDSGNQLIYKTDADAFTGLTEKIAPAAITIPADRGLIAAIAKTEPGNYSIYADINAGQVSLVNFNGGKLRFYNSFSAETIDDTLYYCLFAAEQLNIKPDYTTLIVSGTCSTADTDKLSQFFRLVKYNDASAMATPAAVPAHQILSLAALA